MFIDHRGELQAETSSCLAGYEKAIFTDGVQERFLKLVGREWQPNLQNLPDMGLPAPSWLPPTQHRPVDSIPYEWQLLQRERRRRLQRVNSALRVGQTQLLRKYYERAFEDFQQLNCRVIAKAYVKMTGQIPGPRRYRARSRKDKAEMVAWRRETQRTDHLHKRDSYGVTAAKLKDASLDVRWQIQPEKRLQVLDEIYYVRNQEELYLDGKITGDHMVHVSYGHMEEKVQGSVLDLPGSSSTTHTSQQPIRKSYRDISIISEDLPQRSSRNDKRPADSKCYQPISPPSSASRNSSSERGLVSYSSDVDPPIYRGVSLSEVQALSSVSIPQDLSLYPTFMANNFVTKP
ncbi:hypothetical protein BDW66DRAFT_167480 [Aspergillus desertorum]